MYIFKYSNISVCLRYCFYFASFVEISVHVQANNAKNNIARNLQND